MIIFAFAEERAEARTFGVAMRDHLQKIEREREGGRERERERERENFKFEH